MEEWKEKQGRGERELIYEEGNRQGKGEYEKIRRMWMDKTGEAL